MRLFVSIPAGPALVKELAGVQQRLRSASGDIVRWAKPEQMHLTLRFFGEVPEAELDAIKAALQTCARGVKPFRLHADGLGCFPDLRRPRVIWAGLSGDVARLTELQRSVVAVTRDFGEPPEVRGFQPHLTIGRVKPDGCGRLRRLTDAIAQAGFSSADDWFVAEMHLMRSELSPSGARHTILKTFSFTAPENLPAGTAIH